LVLDLTPRAPTATRGTCAKEILVERFGQFAELRNCIRHSRAVDDVTRKLGETAVLWFRQVLDK
jgi:hypothetical protein